MLLKEELLERVARAICWAENYCLMDEQREKEFEKCKPYYLDCGNSALQAMLNSLPEPHCSVCIEEYYRKLLGMRDK